MNPITKRRTPWTLYALGCAVLSCGSCGCLGILTSLTSSEVSEAIKRGPLASQAEQKTASFKPVPSGVVTGLAQGIERRFTVRKTGWMVKSSQHADAYYVALFLEGAGISEWAVWFVSGSLMAQGGEVGGLAVNPAATEFSDWGSSKNSDAEAKSSDRDCVELIEFCKKKGCGTSEKVKGSAGRKS